MEQTSFGLGNVTKAPVPTILGVLGGLTMAFQALPGGALPTSAAGWAQFATGAVIGVFGLLAR